VTKGRIVTETSTDKCPQCGKSFFSQAAVVWLETRPSSVPAIAHGSRWPNQSGRIHGIASVVPVIGRVLVSEASAIMRAEVYYFRWEYGRNPVKLGHGRSSRRLAQCNGSASPDHITIW